MIKMVTPKLERYAGERKMCSHFVLIPMRVYKVPVSISRAPATDKAGVISG